MQHAPKSFRFVYLGCEPTPHGRESMSWYEWTNRQRRNLPYGFSRSMKPASCSASYRQGFALKVHERERLLAGEIWRAFDQRFANGSGADHRRRLFRWSASRESARMTWDMVDFKRKHIDLPAEIEGRRTSHRRHAGQPCPMAASVPEGVRRSPARQLSPKALGTLPGDDLEGMA